jgi:TRAP-type transport system small permease protein
MRRLGTALFTLPDVLMVVCLVGTVIMVFGDVVLRYGFDPGICMSEEVSRFLVLWLTFLGVIAALRNFDHLGVDSLLKAVDAWGNE